MAKKKKNRDNILTRSFKTEIFFSEKDSLILDGQSKINNWLYNQLLEISIDDFNLSGNTLKLASGNNARDYMINTLKPKHPFLNTVNTRVTNNTAMRLATSYKNFFERGYKGFPKFKSWSRNWFSLHYSEIAERGVKIDNHDVKISLGKDEKGERLYVHGKLDTKLPYSCNYKLIDMTITKKQKRFFVSIVVDFEKKRQIDREKNVDKWIVIDPNHKNFFVGLDYEGNSFEFSNQDCFKYFNEQIERLCSKISKCKKQKVKKIYDKDGKYEKTEITDSSKRYKRLERTLYKARNTRQEQIKTFCYSLAQWLAKDYDYIGIGDYVPTKDVTTSTKMRKSMLNDSHIGKFRGIVEKVCIKSYKTYEKINERYTTMTCSCCGHREKHDPSEREFICKMCKTTFYRDINSCLNFMNNLGLNLSGTDYDSLVKTKPTYTFKINHRTDSIRKVVDRERRIKEKL